VQRILELQANQIETLLSKHRIPSQVLGGTVTPRTVRFELALDLGARITQVQRLSEELALSLSVPTCRIVRQDGILNIEVPRARPKRVGLLEVSRRLSHIPPCTPLLGLDEAGLPLLLNLRSPDVAHVLISGTTGSGKTALARCMALSLTMNNPQRLVQLVLIDPKGRSFAPLSGLPHLLCPMESSIADVKDRLGWLVAEMEHRDEHGRCEPRLVVFVDELAELLLLGGREVELAITRLSQRGRESGVHLVACVQKPTVSLMGSLAKANFPLRIVGSVTSADEARIAAGIAGTGAERLGGHGDFVLVTKGRSTRFTAAYAGIDDIHTIVQQVQPGNLATAAPERQACRALQTKGPRPISVLAQGSSNDVFKLCESAGGV